MRAASPPLVAHAGLKGNERGRAWFRMPASAEGGLETWASPFETLASLAPQGEDSVGSGLARCLAAIDFGL
jgi:hypothetical protein